MVSYLVPSFGGCVSAFRHVFHEYLSAKHHALDAWAVRLLEFVEGQDRASNVVSLKQ